jgi:hypothetical protein
MGGNTPGGSRIYPRCDEAAPSHHVRTKQDRKAQLARDGRERALQAKYRSHGGENGGRPRASCMLIQRAPEFRRILALSSEM